MGDIALPITGATGPARGRRLLSDERLAKLVARGDARAFVALYQRNHQQIYRYCRSILRHDQDAQDALQNTMMRAYAALRAQQRDVAVRPWLFRIAHNESISILRRRTPTRELSEELEHTGVGVHGALETRERLSTLVADLQALPERQRGALLMRELSGLSIEEIAQALTISTAVAKQTLFEARGSLRELAEGRAMSCELVTRAISDGDGRVLRSRRLRAHLHACEDCRSFKGAIDTRTADLHALAPALPAASASALLARLLAHSAGHGGGASAAGLSLGGHAAGSMLAKGLAAVTIAAVTAAATARLITQHHHHHHSSGAAVPAGSGHPFSSQGGSLPAGVGGRAGQSRLAALPGVPGGVHSAHGHTRNGFGSSNARHTTALSGALQPSLSGASAHGQGSAHRRGGENNRSAGGSTHGHHSHGTRENGRAGHPSRSHGSTSHRPKHESHRQASHHGGAGSRSPQNSSSSPGGEAHGIKGTSGQGRAPREGEAASETGHGRSPQAKPKPTEAESARGK